MRQVFLSLFFLLFCLIFSCTKENVSSFDDKIYKKWEVQYQITEYSGPDTVLVLDWRKSDTTSITMDITPIVVTSVILDELLNIIPGRADTLLGLFKELDTDLIQIGQETFHIKHLTPSGMELEYIDNFYDDMPFTKEKRNISLLPL